jgi:hypothetical protein
MRLSNASTGFLRQRSGSGHFQIMFAQAGRKSIQLLARIGHPPGCIVHSLDVPIDLANADANFVDVRRHSFNQ